jgi:phosphopantetheine adenylyltransferase
MSRKIDSRKIEKIRKVLKNNPNGLWVREIARQADLDKSTVSIYLNTHMKREVEEIFLVNGGQIKIVKLKG